jgi:hypothetical protein
MTRLLRFDDPLKLRASACAKGQPRHKTIIEP